MTINQAKEMEMVDYLSRLGHEPQRISGKSYWYLSPFRVEKEASFKINRSLNRWYDFAEGNGGNLVDFGILYHRCGVVEFLQKLNIPDPNLKRPLRELTTPKLVYETGKFEIISTHMLSSYPLLYYLKMCRISHEIASRYCVEVRYKIGDKLYYAIGFKNNAGGYELRNPNFKGSSSPKGSTFIDNGAQDLAVFEGFFDFLSYQSNYAKQELPARNYLVLNSATLFERNLTKMQNHDHIHLFLDNDKKGQKYTLYELTLDREKFKDERHLYQKYNELNNWIMHVGLSQKQELKQKP